ncbi:MAG: ketohydroxyglutarate aldolase [Cyanobacteria bacterium J06648_1]
MSEDNATPRIKISISVDDAHLSAIEQVSQQLKSTGMNVEQILSAIGVISGSIQSEKVNSLYKINGIQNIMPERTIQLSPPNLGIQ